MECILFCIILFTVYILSVEFRQVIDELCRSDVKQIHNIFVSDQAINRCWQIQWDDIHIWYFKAATPIWTIDKKGYRQGKMFCIEVSSLDLLCRLYVNWTRSFFQEEKLRISILDYLQRYHPDDTDTYTMVSLYFSMNRQIANMLENTAQKHLAALKGKVLGKLRVVVTRLCRL